MTLFSFPERRLSRVAASMAALGVAMLTGCAGLNGTAPSSISTYSSPATITGTAHGGQQPVFNSTVRLYSAGLSGYGQGSQQLATSAPTDAGGSFSFTKSGTNSDVVNSSGSSWACPTTGDPIIYITASGGDPTGSASTTTNNTAIGLMAVLGPCSTVSSSTHVILNELTTVASVTALAPYINPHSLAGTATVGSSGTTQGQLGIKNAAAGVVNLVNNDSGQVPAPPQYTGSGTAAGITVTATAESTKLITMANILAACINTTSNTSDNCADLFASAQSASGAMPADTIQAAYYMATNAISSGAFTSCKNGGTTRLGCLFGLASANAPFQPNLSTAPLDWTIGVTFTATGTCSGAGGGGLAAGGPFINGTFKAAVDATGNIWFLGGNSTGSNVAEMSPIGVPMMCYGNGPQGRGLTIDPTGNVWSVYNSGSTSLATDIQELPAGSTTPIAWPITGGTPYTIASDGQGNIFYAINATGSINEFINPGTTTTPFPPITAAANMNGGSTATMGGLAVDAQNRIWGATSSTPKIYGVVPGAAQTPVVIASYSITSNVVTFTTAPNTLQAGSTVTIAGLTTGAYLNNQSLPVLASPAPTATSFSIAFTHADVPPTVDIGTATPPTPYTFTAITSLNNNYGMAIDSSNFLYSGTSCCNSATYQQVEKFTPATPLSATTYATSTRFAGGMNGVRGVAVDGAGNVWVGSEYPSIGDTTSTTNFALTELSGTDLSALSPPTTLSPISTASSGGNCTTTVGCPTGGGFVKAGMGQTRDIEIDLSGNVWAFNFGTEASQGTGTTIVELVGAGTPIVQPYSLAAKTNMVATRP